MPRGPALVHRASSGPVALGAPVGFPVAMVPSPTPGDLSPPALLGGCAGHLEAGQEPGSLCLLLTPAEARALGALRVVPVQGPRWGCPWRVPAASVLGCVCCGSSACVDPVTDASGFPYRPSFDGGLSRCTGAVSCGCRHLPSQVGGRHARVPCVCVCVRVRALLGLVGRASLPGAFWCATNQNSSSWSP